MNIDYIIVQAGGKGTRMKELTRNRPKALVPINNLPMLFHLFKKFPNKKYIIIGDYKIDVLKKYLRVFSPVEYYVVDARGKTGTCSGVDLAIEIIPDNTAFMMIWSDLVLPQEFELPVEEANYIGLSRDFNCRWSYKESQFIEQASEESGVAGVFIFKNKEQILDVPEEGEFVRWLQAKKKKFVELSLWKTKEFGLISEYQKLEKQKCRPFNQLRIENDKIIKEGIDQQGMQLAVRECAWYELAVKCGFEQIPKIYSYKPLVMEKIKGKNIYEGSYDYEEKKRILKKIIISLKKLHGYAEEAVDYFSCENAYFGKTFDRLKKVEELIPFSKERFIVVNGRKCHNVYFYFEELESLCRECIPEKFVFLHGDCTFSNTMLDENENVIFIDPRGYFGYTEMNGDAAYDWAKLYYSIKGNYDQFNLKNFSLEIKQDSVNLKIASNGWEDMEDVFFTLLTDEISEKKVKILHAIIWLSLTTYAWEDYDSICGAFYQGIYYLEEIFAEYMNV